MKNIIGMYFGMKSYLKSTRNHTAKHALTIEGFWIESPNTLFITQLSL